MPWQEPTEDAIPLLEWIRRHGTPSQGAGVLVVVFSFNPALIGLMRPLDQDRLRIGRDLENDLVLEDPRVSRFHAELNRSENDWKLSDCGSANRVFLRGTVLEGQQTLISGDRFEIGGTMLKFVAGTDAEALLFQEFERRARVDGLTGAINRGALDHFLRQEIYRSRRKSHPLALLMLDMDHFKKINDLFGHPAGDRVLIELVRLIKNRLRTHDELARWGGEEFAVLLPETDAAGAQALAEDLRHQVENHSFLFDGEKLRATISIGGAVLKESDTDGAALVARADQALYAAKNAGRNRVVIVSE